MITDTADAFTGPAVLLDAAAANAAAPAGIFPAPVTIATDAAKRRRESISPSSRTGVSSSTDVPARSELVSLNSINSSLSNLRQSIDMQTDSSFANLCSAEILNTLDDKLKNLMRQWQRITKEHFDTLHTHTDLMDKYTALTKDKKSQCHLQPEALKSWQLA